MLGAAKLGFEVDEPYRLASSHNRILQLPQKHALTAGETFRYNGTVITEPAHAYAFRMHAARDLP
jgi:hypothetical protein